MRRESLLLQHPASKSEKQMEEERGRKEIEKNKEKRIRRAALMEEHSKWFMKRIKWCFKQVFLSSLSFTSTLHDCPLFFSLRYRLPIVSFCLPLDSFLSFCLHATSWFFFFLSVYPSNLSIYLACLPVYLSVFYLIFSRFFQTILSLLSLADDISTIWYCIPEIHQNFLTCLQSEIRINQTSVKEANLSSVVMQPLYFPFRLFAKPCGNFVTSNRYNRGQTKLRFFWFRHYKLHIIASFSALKYRLFQAIYTR